MFFIIFIFLFIKVFKKLYIYKYKKYKSIVFNEFVFKINIKLNFIIFNVKAKLYILTKKCLTINYKNVNRKSFFIFIKKSYNLKNLFKIL